MLELNSPQIVQETVLRWKKENKIALVATMGCLHEGHLELVRTAQKFAERVVVSIFVNPLQFGPNEDFAKYPRTYEEDKEKLNALGVDLLFHPDNDDLYPTGFSSKISVVGLTKHLCGATRPGHFDGVATVVMKLFQICQPDFAVFGEKDFQQVRMIEQLSYDMNLPVTIVRNPTVREKDGLALSSRNRYLTAAERERATLIPQILTHIRELSIARGETTVEELLGESRSKLESAGLKVQYLEIASERDLNPVDKNTKIAAVTSPRVFIALYNGTTRLIDNQSLNGVHL